jgi:hypothetical protein
MNSLLFATVDDSGLIRVPHINIGHIFAGVLLSTLVYLTALQWHAAFDFSMKKLQTKHKELNEEEGSYVIAASVTVFAVLAALIVYFALHGHKKLHRVQKRV